MGRVGGVGRPTKLLVGQSPAPAPDGAVTTFALVETGAPGSLGVYRRPVLAALAADVAPATAVPVGIDVAAVGPMLVPTLAEFDALRAIVDQLRTDRDNLQTPVVALLAIVNRSYLRDDPAAYGFGSNFIVGDAPSATSWAALEAVMTDGSLATFSGTRALGAWADWDLGAPQAISHARLFVTYGNGAAGDTRMRIHGRLAAGDAWTLLWDDGANVANHTTLRRKTIANAGPWRYIRFEGVSTGAGSGGGTFRYMEFEVYGAAAVNAVDYVTAPAAGERLIADFARNQ